MNNHDRESGEYNRDKNPKPSPIESHKTSGSLAEIASNVRYRSDLPFTSSTIELEVASPKLVKSWKVQTTRLSRVISMICGFFGPAWQLPRTMLPLGSTWSEVTQASLMPGRSSCSRCQTIFL